MGSTGPLDSYLKFSHNWKSDMEDNSAISDNYDRNIMEYKKIFDVSALNSENEAQYYNSSASTDHNNTKSPTKKGMHHITKRNSTEQWNKNITRAINKINQIVNDDTSSINNNTYIDPNPLKRQNENTFDFKDPYMDNRGILPNNGIEINTTENKREGKREKHEKSPRDPKKRGKKLKESKTKETKVKEPKIKESKVKEAKTKDVKRKSKKSKESKKKDESEFNNNISNEQKEPTEIRTKPKKSSKNKDEILANLQSINTSEIKYDGEPSLNSSLNSSESSINKIIQKSLSEYSRDITDLINKDKENKLKRESDSENHKRHESSTTKPLMMNNMNDAFKELINQNISNNNNSIISDTKNSELNNKIMYIDNLIKEFSEEQKPSNISLANNGSKNVPTTNKKGSGSSEEISIEIKCPFYSNGCTWCNKQSKLSDHLLYECTFCPNIITNAFASNNKANKKSLSMDPDKKKHIEELSQKLNKLTLSLNNDDKAILKKKNKSSEFDRDVLSIIFNNYLNEDNDQKSEKEKSVREKQDGVFDQIIQDYNYNSEESFLFKEDNRQNMGSKLMLNTNFKNYMNEEPIATADINFNNEPLTWDINSEADNKVPWCESPTKIKERKKYKLSDTNHEVRIKNKKSPVTEYYAGKKLLKKYDNLISYYDDNNSDVFNMYNIDLEPSERKRNTPPSHSPEKPFNPTKNFRFELPNHSTKINTNVPPVLKHEPATPDPRIAKDLKDITLCINNLLLNSNKEISSMFTPQEIEVLMDVWFQNENDLKSESSLIFNQSETSFIRNLLSSFDEKTKNNIKEEYNKLKLRESCQNINLLGSIENLLSLRQNEVKEKNATPSVPKLKLGVSNDFTFDFNYERWNKNKNKTHVPQITKELNKAFNLQKENVKKSSNDMNSIEHKKNQFKYMILSWIAKLFGKHTIFTICWKLINILYNCIKYLKNKLIKKALESTKELDKKYKKLQEEQKLKNKTPIPKKMDISSYINNAISKYESGHSLFVNWSPQKKYQTEGRILLKKKKFNKNQALYYRMNQHNTKHNKDKHTLYINFLDYQTNRGFKSLNIQNNIRKKIKMMQIIKDIKGVKTTSIISSNNKNKKRKVEMEKKHRPSVTSYFNNTLNLLMNTLMNNSKTKKQIVEGATTTKQMNIFGAEANIDFNKHTLIIYNKKTSELNYIPKNKDKVAKKAVKLNEIDQLIIYNNDESGWMNILTSKAISNNMDLFYYEVKVGMSNPSKKCLYSWSIGFSTSKVQLNRYPDRLYSWDYYNTGSINKNNSLEKYGETYTQNDTIGCGIDFKNNLAFFTKNGKFLGVAVSNFLTEDLELYPNIGLFNYAKVETNFGAKDFAFNIKSYFYNKLH